MQAINEDFNKETEKNEVEILELKKLSRSNLKKKNQCNTWSIDK